VRADARPKRENAKPKGKPRGKPAKGGDERQKFSAKPKVEKKIDPDNPFAAALAGFNKG
jgi:ATP-dependent RNA helicase SUPV3L1/SUV3